ncbi:MAG: hypothetical protein E4H21_09665 [Thermodesulfobacteriales bacterium]|nr:MAG: hypothetical protein E4H21_09665 [Thermodesulfobacteriales bacterium]
MPSINIARAKILLSSLVITFVVIRVWLFFYPNADLNLLGYNIHHLYTGLLLVTIGGIPLILFSNSGRILNLATAIFGIGLSLALDEWVYLITTDGSNMSYLLPVSFWGGLILVGLACLYIGALYFWFRKKDKT